MNKYFDKKRVIFLIIIILTSFTITAISTNIINLNKINVTTKNKKLQDPASEYTALNTRITSLESQLKSNNDIAAIGGYQNVTPSAVSVANNSDTSVATVTLAAGSWFIIGGARFNSNATGTRRIKVLSGSTVYCEKDTKAVSGAYTYVSCAFAVKTTETSTTFTVQAHHTRGSALSTLGRMQVLRIK